MPPRSILRPLVALVLKAKKLRRRRNKTLAAKLSNAQRINAPPSATQEDKDYCHPTESSRISQLITQADGDGLWKCCNAHEQELVHWSGRHPFKHLTCVRCKHVLCKSCCTTAVVSPIQWNNAQIVELAKSKHLIHFGQICPSCGLTHRARTVKTVIDTDANETVPTLSFDGQLCACGRLADESWVKFKIGPIYEYRKDPHNAFAALSLQRAESSVLLQQDGVDRSASSSAVSLAPERWAASLVEEKDVNGSASSISLVEQPHSKATHRPSTLSKDSLPRESNDVETPEVATQTTSVQLLDGVRIPKTSDS